MRPAELTEWRKKLGLTQDEAARRLGKSRVTIQNWESGTTPISPSVEPHCRQLAEQQRRRPDYGPVVLRDAGGHAGNRKNIREEFPTNQAALVRAAELYAENAGIDLFIESLDGQDIWRIRELRDAVDKGRSDATATAEEPGLAERLMEIGRHFSSLPVYDDRSPDEIIGYDENGLPR